VKKYILYPICGLLLVCCAKYVLVPPAIDLYPYDKVGLITFTLESEEAEDQLDTIATQYFLQDILYSQGGVQIIEIGSRDDVLRETNQTKLDLEAASAVGARFDVSAYFHGSIQVSDVKPKVDVIGLVQGGRVQAVFDMTVTARMISTETGATLWTDSIFRKGNVAYMSMTRGGVPYFDVRDKDDEMKRMIEDIISELTRDFRPSKQRIK